MYLFKKYYNVRYNSSWFKKNFQKLIINNGGKVINLTLNVQKKEDLRI